MQKLRHYCAYQERCHSEVKEKLYSFGLRKQEIDEIIADLIEENYLNEERFAIQFAGGKFRMKKWGRVKIKHELKARQVSEYCMKKALKEIPEEDYYQTLLELAEARWQKQKHLKNVFARLKNTRDYLIQKGYEISLIQDVIKEVRGKNSD